MDTDQRFRTLFLFIQKENKNYLTEETMIRAPDHNT